MTIVAAISLFIWVYLALFHGRFWQCDQRINQKEINIKAVPSIAAVIPARNEAETIAGTVRALLDQNYPLQFQVIVIDDGSDDGTADVARAAAVNDDERARVSVIDGQPLATGWSGKLWAVSQGIEAAGDVDYLLLTDADIRHAPMLVGQLVGKAEGDGLRLVSLMVRLRCRSLWERLLIPAFVYFFQKLYPFPWVNTPTSRTAAAAGGCMLVHRETLAAQGGVEAIKGALIDDCALARLIKPAGAIWLGLATETLSLRAYDTLAPIWRMVARTAYVQLKRNPMALFGTIAAMFLIYVVPPLALIAGLAAGDPWTAGIGAAAWVIMVWTYLPVLDLYGLPGRWALTLPMAGLLFAAMTADSARRHYAGKGGYWKGRSYPG